MALQPPFYDPPIADYPSGQQHSQAWTEYHQSVADELAGLVSGGNSVTNGSEAGAGNIGEFRTISVPAGSAAGLGNLAAASVTHLNLTPGDWELWGTVVFQPAGTTTVNVLAAWINSAAAAVPGTLESEGYVSLRATFTAGAHQALAVGRVRLLNGAAQTMHLNALAGFGVSSMVAYGVLNARRVR
jgi:hypothetical protein